jgi:hypothetical protein
MTLYCIYEPVRANWDASQELWGARWLGYRRTKRKQMTVERAAPMHTPHSAATESLPRLGSRAVRRTVPPVVQ